MNTRSLLIPVDGATQLTELPQDDIRVLSALVGGTFQCVPIAAGISLWLNEEGKGLGLPWNQHAQILWDRTFGAGTDYIVGPAVLTSGADDEGDTLGITDEQIAFVEQTLSLVRVRIENTYEDGHSSTVDVWLPGPEDIDDPDSIESWWDDVVFDHTGDGHGATHPKLGSLHECTVISGPAQLAGETYEWGG